MKETVIYPKIQIAHNVENDTIVMLSAYRSLGTDDKWYIGYFRRTIPAEMDLVEQLLKFNEEVYFMMDNGKIDPSKNDNEFGLKFFKLDEDQRSEVQRKADFANQV